MFTRVELITIYDALDKFSKNVTAVTCDNESVKVSDLMTKVKTIGISLEEESDFE